MGNQLRRLPSWLRATEEAVFATHTLRLVGCLASVGGLALREALSGAGAREASVDAAAPRSAGALGSRAADC